MANIKNNLRAANENGTKICLICGYNIQRTPLVTLWKSTSDGTVDTKYASLGAVCGDVKEPLTDNYLYSLQSREYLSPDYMIDASTCAFPEYTWFVRDWLHCNGNSGIDELFNLVMTSDEFNIRSSEKFPQFLEADDDADTVYPVTGRLNELERLKAHPSYLNFVRFIFAVIKSIFGLFNK